MKQGNSPPSLSERPSEHGTPRTDAQAPWPSSIDSPDKYSPDGAYVDADFARQLERENAELVAALKDVEFELTAESSQRLPAKGFERLHRTVCSTLAKVGK